MSEVVRPRAIAGHVASFAVRTPTLPPATHTNSYALGTRDVILVEPATPFDDERRAWLEWARGLEAQGRRLVATLVTHHHGDHVGGAAFLSRELGLPLWAHRLTASRVEAPVARCLEEGELLVLDGPTASAWEVLHTPGHAPGHVCLVDRAARIAVVGDMVASEGTILVAPGDGDMREYLAQLARLEALGLATALPAHGAPIEAPDAVFAHYIAHRLAREAKVRRCLADFGAAGARLPDLVETTYDDVPPPIRPIAMLSLEAHLDKLVFEGLASCTGDRWTAAP